MMKRGAAEVKKIVINISKPLVKYWGTESATTEEGYGDKLKTFNFQCLQEEARFC